MLSRVFIALGSNLGDRRGHLDQAVARLRQLPGLVVARVSSYHETAAIGGPPGQPDYLNAVAELVTDLSPEELLSLLLAVEHDAGRVRGEPNAPRTLDLDLLLYGSLVRAEPDPIIPHPRMHERRFVLEPLAELAPDVVHPSLHVAIKDLLARLGPGPAKAAATPTPSPHTRELTGLRTVVTGATSGIGRAIALELAAAGAQVGVHGRRGPAADQVVEEIRGRGAIGHVLLADLSDPSACDHLAAEAWRLWDGIDVWVNNAGADTLTGDAANWSFDRKLAALWAVDVLATIRLSRQIGARMKQRGSGVILTTGWDQAETGMDGDSGQLFAAAKAAVMGFTRSLAVTLAPEVRVNCLAPGWIKTAWGETASDAWQNRARRESPLGRWGTPRDVASVARFLASPAAAFLTGQIVRINGGAVRG